LHFPVSYYIYTKQTIARKKLKFEEAVVPLVLLMSTCTLLPNGLSTCGQHIIITYGSEIMATLEITAGLTKKAG